MWSRARPGPQDTMAGQVVPPRADRLVIKGLMGTSSCNLRVITRAGFVHTFCRNGLYVEPVAMEMSTLHSLGIHNAWQRTASSARQLVLRVQKQSNH